MGHWFARGVQSAIFHYASCAPCTGAMRRRKRNKQAAKEHAAKKALEAEQPEHYFQPSPSTTNPYWTEEIAMGPGPPPRRRGKSSRTESRRVNTVGTQSSAGSRDGSSLIISPRAGGDPMRSDDTLSDDNWNRRRYQREDEDLWGLGDEDPRVRPGRQQSTAGSSIGLAGIPQPESTRGSEQTYYTARLPPVNDLHPPIVSTLSKNPADMRWMLQPPPKAAIMNGKERASNRSRSGSGASSKLDVNSHRQVGHRRLEERLQRTSSRSGTPDTSSLSRASSSNYQRMPLAPNSRPASSGAHRSVNRGPPLKIHTEAAKSSDTIVYTPTMPADSAISGISHRHSRAALSTIVSSGSLSPPAMASPLYPSITSPSSGENSPPDTRRVQKRYDGLSDATNPVAITKPDRAVVRDSSLKLLQEVVSPSALLNSRFIRAPAVEARFKLPAADSTESFELEKGKQHWWRTEEGWITPTTPRDKSMRWSVDF